MAGRKKTPTKLKVLRGSFRKDRANPNEPDPENHIPDAPDHLSNLALIEWGRMSSILMKLGLLSDIDRTALAIYCQTYARMVKYEKIVLAEGEMWITAKGNMQLNPAMWIVNKSIEQCHKFLSEFGMSPASRAKVTATKTKKKDDPWADIV